MYKYFFSTNSEVKKSNLQLRKRESVQQRQLSNCDILLLLLPNFVLTLTLYPV